MILVALWAPVALPAAALAGSEEPIRIEALEPAIVDTTLVCTVHTRGLPGAASRETLASGLPSALVVAFSLLDGRGREHGVSRVEVRIEPDLWEQMLIVRSPLVDRRVSSLEEVAALIASLGPLPVLPLGRLPAQSIVRIRARLAVHPLAPAEFRRVGVLFEGQPTGTDPNRHESSVGLGSLVRYFLGREPTENWVADAVSPPFDWRRLVDRR